MFAESGTSRDPLLLESGPLVLRLAVYFPAGASGSDGVWDFLSIPDFPLRPMFLEAVAERWNFRTSSIVTRAGEFVLSLEDMVRLTGLPITGRPVTGRVRSGYSALAQELVGRQLAISGEQLVVITSTVRRVSELAETVAGPGVEVDQ